MILVKAIAPIVNPSLSKAEAHVGEQLKHLVADHTSHVQGINHMQGPLDLQQSPFLHSKFFPLKTFIGFDDDHPPKKKG